MAPSWTGADAWAPWCRILKEERNYILQMIKKIRASGCNVLLIQKSILRDAVTDLSLHYLVCTCPPCTHHVLLPAPAFRRRATSSLPWRISWVKFAAEVRMRGMMNGKRVWNKYSSRSC